MFVHRLFSILLLTFIFSASLAQDSLSIDSMENIEVTFADTASENRADTIVQKTKPVIKKLGNERTKSAQTTHLLLGLGVFLLFGLLRFFNPKYINELFGTLTRSNLSRLSSSERIWQSLALRMLFLVIYFLSGGYIVGLLIDYYTHLNVSEFTYWFYGVSIVFGLFVLKYLTINSVALVFRFSSVAKYFFKHLSVVNQIVGLILLPISGILLILPPKMDLFILFPALIILSISLIFKTLISMGYVRNIPNVNYMHFIVYLCTLEFIPLAVFVRYALDGFGV